MTNRDQQTKLNDLSDFPIKLGIMSANEAILANFYGVTCLSELVQAQARHIEKLQEKLRPESIRITTRLREG